MCVGMGAYHGGEVINQFPLIETPVGGFVRYGLNRADPAGERRKKAICVPGMPLHNERRNGVAVPPVRLRV